MGSQPPDPTRWFSVVMRTPAISLSHALGWGMRSLISGVSQSARFVVGID